MLIGYAWVTREGQNLEVSVLERAGCERVFTDDMSRARTRRPGLAEAISAASEGDVLVVRRLLRLGPSLRHVTDVVSDLHARSIELRSLLDGIDTSAPGDDVVFRAFSAIAELERELGGEDPAGVLKSTPGRDGRHGVQVPMKKKMQAVHALRERDLTVAQICELLGISRSTFYRYWNHKPNAPRCLEDLFQRRS